ncbi:MAG: serine hydrolase [Myxococcota bacterium]
MTVSRIPTEPAATVPTPDIDVSSSVGAGDSASPSRLPGSIDAPDHRERPVAPSACRASRQLTGAKMAEAIQGMEKAGAQFATDPKNALAGWAASVSTAAGDQLNVAGGFAKVAHDGVDGVKATSETIFNCASISKAVTSLAIQMVIAEVNKTGKAQSEGVQYGLHTKLAQTPFGKGLENHVTLDRMLSMRAGLSRDMVTSDGVRTEPAITDDNVDDPKKFNPEAPIDGNFVTSLQYDPARPSFRYSNQGLNGVAEIAGQMAITYGLVKATTPLEAFKEFTETRLFKPLRIADKVSFAVKPDQQSNQADEYGGRILTDDGRVFRADLLEKTPADRGSGLGSWGLYASPAALNVLQREIFRAAEGRQPLVTHAGIGGRPGKPVIAREHVLEMFKPHSVDAADVYGYGAFPSKVDVELKGGETVTLDLVGHSGGSYGSRAWAFTDINTGITITLAGNAPDYDRAGLAKAVLAPALQALKDEGKLTGLVNEKDVAPLRSFIDAPKAVEEGRLDATIFAPPALRFSSEANLSNTPELTALLSRPDRSGSATCHSRVGYGGLDTVELRSNEQGGFELAMSKSVERNDPEAKPVVLPLRKTEDGRLYIPHTSARTFNFDGEEVRIGQNSKSGELEISFGTGGTHVWAELREHGKLVDPNSVDRAQVGNNRRMPKVEMNIRR